VLRLKRRFNLAESQTSQKARGEFPDLFFENLTSRINAQQEWRL
jgi:hypothetical protein